MAIWVPDLTGRRGPKYLQIVEVLAEDIVSGRLTPGEKLPPHRELAYQLGLSPHTASRAYAEAVRRALIRGEVGRGSFVRAADPAVQVGEWSGLRREVTGPIDLSRNLPFPGFAEPHIRRVLGEISAGNGVGALLDYQTDGDLAHHSDAAIAWLDLCGIKAEVDQVVTTMGAQHGVLCTLIALLRPGDLLLTEALTYAPVRAMAERLGLHMASVAMDADGTVPDAFAELCLQAKPKAFYLIPTLHVPTTVTLSDARRQAIAQIAQRHDVMLIEDDVFGLLKADRPAPLATWAPEHTVYVTSLSKVVAPGLRVGFLRAPAQIAPALQHALNLSIWMAPPMTLEVAARVIREGHAEWLTTQQREAAERRQSLARTVLAQVDFVADPQGLHLWMPLPADWKADAFRAQCAKSGVLVSEGGTFAADANNAPEAIRVCLSHEASDIRLEQGLRTIAKRLRLPPSVSAMEI